jgi:hypothetical protein
MKGKRIPVVFLTVFLSYGLLFPAGLAIADFSGSDRLQRACSAEAAANRMREEEAVARLTTEPARVIAGSPAVVRFSLTDAAGKPIQGLTMMHERYVHVVIVSQDFSVFAHIHPRDFERLTPEVLKGARFFVRFTFPKAGRYVVGLDFAVKGRPFGRHFVVDVAGKPGMTAPEKDFKRTERAGGLDVSFATTPEPIRAKYNAVLNYVFKEKGKPVTDLNPWLGAPMHLAIVSSDLKYFIHVHGEVPGMTAHMHSEDHMHMHVPPKFGPKIEVPIVFPAKGLYKVFGQVGHKGKVILTRFMVEVE